MINDCLSNIYETQTILMRYRHMFVSDILVDVYVLSFYSILGPLSQCVPMGPQPGGKAPCKNTHTHTLTYLINAYPPQNIARDIDDNDGSAHQINCFWALVLFNFTLLNYTNFRLFKS